MFDNQLNRRRALLIGAWMMPMTLAAGCTTGQAPDPEPPPEHPLAPGLRAHVSLRATYDASIAAHPPLAPRLQPLVANIDAHIAALAAAQGVPPAGAGSTTTPATGGVSSSSPAASPIPPDPPSALLQLAAAETDLLAEMRTLISSVTAEQAPLLGSILAAHATHVVALS